MVVGPVGFSVIVGGITTGITTEGEEGDTVNAYDEAYVSSDHEIVSEFVVAPIGYILLGAFAAGTGLIAKTYRSRGAVTKTVPVESTHIPLGSLP
jgi:hypothetical protein